MADLGNPNPSEGMGDRTKQSPRLAAMRRRREKRAAAAASAAVKVAAELAGDGDKSESRAEELEQGEARKMVEIHEAPARWSEIREAMRKEKELRKSSVLQQPTVLKNLPPARPLLVRCKKVNALKTSRSSYLHRHYKYHGRECHSPPSSSSRRLHRCCGESGMPAPRVAVLRVDGQRLTGSLRRLLRTVSDTIICCDCHNLMFTPQGFLNHAGWRGLSEDDPLKYIMMLRD